MRCCQVIDLSRAGRVVPGLPDLIIAIDGRWVFIEVKAEEKKKRLTKPEKIFHGKYAPLAPTLIVDSPQDAVSQVRALRRKWKNEVYA